MRLPLLVILLADLDAIVLGAIKPKSGLRRRPPKPINWNRTYYTEPFKLCKPARELNPVETVKAHGLAVDAFRICGPKNIVHYAQRYKFPAFAIMKASEWMCFLFQVGGGYFDLNGRPKSTDEAEANGILEVLSRFCSAVDIGNMRFTARNGKQIFRMDGVMCRGFVYAIIECALKEVGFRDTEAGVYTIGHFRKMLL